MYQTRLRPAGVNAETEFHKTDDLLIRGVQGDYTRGDTVVLLDPKGINTPPLRNWRMPFMIGSNKEEVV